MFSVLFLVWVTGFLWFVVALPRAAEGGAKTDAVIVPTGGAGRIGRGLEVLDQGLAPRLLVSGVDPEVRPGEFAAEFGVAPQRMACCVTLGFAAVDTRSNAAETAKWVAQNEVRSLRLVTTDWHMRRAAGELARALPDHVTLIRDAVPSQPDLGTLFLEYHKLLASWAAGLAEV
jgi:uncharacterized SAM-binding protein YcdF (DUF218 family)